MNFDECFESSEKHIEHGRVLLSFFQIDLKKMPLGKLTRRQIESAYSVLGEAQKVSDIFLRVLVNVYTINN